MDDFFPKLHKFIKDIRKRPDFGRLNHESIYNALYDELFGKEYSYLCTMTGHPGIAWLPLPWFMKPGSSRLFQTHKTGPTHASNEHMLPAKKLVCCSSI